MRRVHPGVRPGAAQLIAAALLTVASLAVSAPADAAQPVRRFALVVGANSGGAERVTLRYANSDARRFARVVGQYGGVLRRDLLTLYEATPDKIRAATETLCGRIAEARAAHRRVELVFYYSGHSDERGLLPGGQRMAWSELRKRLHGLGADVRIAILDSCASGAMIRTKGGKRRAPFLFDASSEVKGHAYLTSSSADEVAQESDRIQASYFTHHLVTGLRGAADVDNDRRVTLSEAYQYAFHRTLRRTERTAKGPQHANYDFELAGKGDIVLTGLSRAASVLVFGKPLHGHYFVRDAQGRLVAELDKVPGRRLELGLEPGTYKLHLHHDTRVLASWVRLERGRRLQVDPRGFEATRRVATRSRGNEPLPSARVTGRVDNPSARVGIPTRASGSKRVRVPMDVSFVPGVSLVGVPPESDVTHAAWGVIGNLHHDTAGLAAAGVINIATGTASGVQGAGVINIAGEGVRGLQGAGAVNISGGTVQGTQLAGAVNIAGGRVTGSQLAGAVNYADRLDGVQLTAATNIGGEVRGVQVAGGVNIARNLTGLQLSVVNVAGTSTGTQVGLFNVSTGGSSDAYGLLSFIRGGYNHIEAWTSDTGLGNVGVKFGGRHMYTVITAGYSLQSEEAWEVGAGVGGHFALTRRLYLDADFIVGSQMNAKNNPERVEDMMVRSRLAIGFALFDRLALFAGVKANWVIAFDHREGRETRLSSTRITPEEEQTSVSVGPGFFVGVRL